MKSMLRRFLVLSSLGGLAACQPDLLSGASSDREDPGAPQPAEITAQAARIPRITSVVPSVASNLGGTILTVNGRSFDTATQVFMDGKPAEFAGLLSSTQLSVQLPRGVFKAGPVTLKVVNGDGRQSERSDVLTLFAETTALVGQRVPLGLSGLASGARVLTTGDFNGDGLPDAVAQDYLHLYVLLARGRGTYSEPLTTDVPSGTMASLVDVGDVNGDGKLDLVSGMPFGPSLLVFPGRGDGTFAAPIATSFPTVGSYYGVALSDVNKDGRADLLLVGNTTFPATTPYSLSVYLAGSDGRYGTAPLLTPLTEPARISARDLNADGHLDLLLLPSSRSEVWPLLGDSTGKFATGPGMPVDRPAREVAFADYNGDGKLDIATLGADGKLSVRSGRGDGSFTGSTVITVNSSVGTLAAGDVTGDGKPDLVVGSDSSYGPAGNLIPGGAWLLGGNGDGTFLSPQDLSLFPLWGTSRLRIADADKDGKNDVQVYGDGKYLVLYGRGGGQFAEDRQFPAPATAMATGDVNGDGKVDLATVSVGTNKAYVSLNGGDGVLLAPRVLDTDRGPGAVALADVTGDGKTDLLVANYDAGTVSLLPGNGDGSFLPQRVLPTAIGTTALVVADVNGDLKPDVVTANYESNNVSVLINAGSGSFASAKHYATAAGPAALVVADFNKDGRMDVATANLDANSVSYLQGSAVTAGTLNSARSVASGGRGPVALAARDVTGDGSVDLLVGNSDSGDLSLIAGRGDGTFSSASSVANVGRVIEMAVADLSGDGRVDVLVSTGAGPSGTTNLYYGFAGGVFAPSARSVDVGGPIAVGDMTGDGKPDLLVARTSGMILLHANRSP